MQDKHSRVLGVASALCYKYHAQRSLFSPPLQTLSPLSLKLKKGNGSDHNLQDATVQSRIFFLHSGFHQGSQITLTLINPYLRDKHSHTHRRTQGVQQLIQGHRVHEL